MTSSLQNATAALAQFAGGIGAVQILQLGATLAALQVAFWLVRWQRVKRAVAHLPGLDNGLLGPIPLVMKHIHDLYDWDTSLIREHGDNAKVTEAFWKNYATIVTVKPENLEHFLKTNFRNYVKPHDLRRRLRDLLGDGIFVVNHGYKGEHPMWHAQRKIMSKIFFKKNFEGFLQKVFIRHSLRLCEVLQQHAENDTVVDAQQLMFAFTLDSIAEIGFGTSFGALDKPMRVAAAFDLAQEGCFMRVVRPFYEVPVLGQLLYSAEREHLRLVKELDDFSHKTIKERRESIAQADSHSRKAAEVGEDCLSLFLTHDMAKEMQFSDTQLRDIIINVLLAGRDTTACTLSFAVAELMLNPAVTSKLLDEMREKLAHTSVFGGEATVRMEDVTQRNMPYFHGFIYEVLRLHPPVPVDAKEAVEEDEWPDGTRIPAGSTIVFHPYAMGRDERRWPNPLELKPERWANYNPTAFEFPVFQAGPRICLGLRMAVLEAKLCLVHVLPAFDFRPSANCQMPPTYKVRLTQSIKGGLPVHVKAR